MIPLLLTSLLAAGNPANQTYNVNGQQMNPCQTMQQIQNMGTSKNSELKQMSCEKLRDGQIEGAQAQIKNHQCDSVTINDGALKESVCNDARRALHDANSDYQQCKQNRAQMDANLAEQQRAIQKACADWKQEQSHPAQQVQTGPTPQELQKQARQQALQNAVDNFKRQQEEAKRQMDQAAHAYADGQKAKHAEAVQGIGKAQEDLQEANYQGGGTNKDDVAKMGHTEDSYEDLIDTVPQQRNTLNANVDKQDQDADSCVKTEMPTWGDDKSCKPIDGVRDREQVDTEGVLFSCRLTPPAKHGGCKWLSTSGSGRSCMGPVYCCLAPRERVLVMRASQNCPIRTCHGCLNKEKCPPAENDCAIVDSQPNWPSIKAFWNYGNAPVIPQPLDDFWGAQACRTYESAVHNALTQALTQHEQDFNTRHQLEASGEDITAPHACGHHVQFAQVAHQLDLLRDATIKELNRELQLKRGCDTPLKQIDLDARSVAYDLRWWVVKNIQDFNPDIDDHDGPYYTWGRGGDSRPYQDFQWARICDSIEAYRRCEAQSGGGAKPPPKN